MFSNYFRQKKKTVFYIKINDERWFNSTIIIVYQWYQEANFVNNETR